MTAPVRIRGEVGERRVRNTMYLTHARGPDRRTSPSTAARVDAIVARFKAALAELQQQHRDDRAVDVALIETLTRQLNEHMDEVVSLTMALQHANAEIARLRGEARLLAALVRDEAKLASGQAEGCHE